MPDYQIKTRNVKEHRRLRFESIDDVLAEIDRIAKADSGKSLRATGNWTPGQIMSHVAAWIEYGYEGYPMESPPWIIRFLLKRMGRKYLRKGMPKGARIPGAEHGTWGMDEMATADAAERLSKAFLRLKNGESVKFDSPGFGPMSDADRIQLNLRHAELHLGFLDY